MAQTQGAYYVPHGSHWPIVGSIGLFSTVIGAANWFNDGSGLTAKPLMFVGLAILVFMMFGWFGTVIRESVVGMYNKQVDTSFRMGMMWFIFSEVMFFAAFFGALFYARMFSVPWVGGEGHGGLTNYYLWQGFTPSWPTNGPGDIGGSFETIPAWHLPLLNTLLLLSSGVTITFAHHALRAGHRKSLLAWLEADDLLSGGGWHGLVGGDLQRVLTVALERFPKVRIVRPLHLHPPTGFQHRQQRDQVGLECVVMDRVGMFQVGGDDFKSTRDETAAMEAFEDDHVFAEIAVCGFGSHATSSPRSASASSSMSSVTVSSSCNRS